MPSLTGLSPVSISSSRPTTSAERTKSVRSTQPAPSMPWLPFSPSGHSSVRNVVSPESRDCTVSSRPITRTASTSQSSSGSPKTVDSPLMHSEPPLCWKISMIGSRSSRFSA